MLSNRGMQRVLNRIRQIHPLKRRRPVKSKSVAIGTDHTETHLRVRSRKRAAVIVALFARNGDIHVLLTRRNLHMRSHAGEVSLPGGKEDPEDDGNLAHTAVRECWEEVGIGPSHVFPLATCPSFLSKAKLRVTPVVAWIPGEIDFRKVSFIEASNPSDWAEEHHDSALDNVGVKPLVRTEEVADMTMATSEVSSVFSVPLRLFTTAYDGIDTLDSQGTESKEHTGQLYVKHTTQLIQWLGSEFTMHTYNYAVPKKDICIYEDDGSGHVFRIWGLTASILRYVANYAFAGETDANATLNQDNRPTTPPPTSKL